MAKTLKRTRRPSHPKGEHTPPVYQRKKNYRAKCKVRAADGMGNDAGTGQWVDISRSTRKADTFGVAGSKLRGGATKSGPRPHPEYYGGKVTDA